jgi:hypothetical protein
MTTTSPRPARSIPGAGPARPDLLRPVRTATRYAVRHGLPAVYLARAARRGDPSAACCATRPYARTPTTSTSSCAPAGRCPPARSAR